MHGIFAKEPRSKPDKHLDNLPDPALGSKGGVRVERLRFRHAPLLAAAILFALGEILARSWQPTGILLLAVALLTLISLWVLLCDPGVSRRIFHVRVGALWVTVGMGSAEVRPAHDQQKTLLRYADGLSRRIHGQVIRVRDLPPIETKEQDTEVASWDEQTDADQSKGALSIDLQVDAIEEVTPESAVMVPIAGGVRLSVVSRDGSAMPRVGCGDTIDVPLQMRIPERYRDPGAWQYADYLLEQGIGAQASVRGERLAVLPRGNATLQCRLYALQSWSAARLAAYVSSAPNRHLPRLFRWNADDAGMLGAMLFGDRSRLSHRQRLGFERTGSFHLFVVSGMHVALVAGGIFWIARRLRLREWIATSLTLGMTAGYALTTGFGAPVQRALWMTAVFLLARLLTRDRSVLNALGAAALVVLVWSPAALFEASFQMTFLAIVAIGGIAVPMGERSFLRYGQAARHLRDTWRDVGFEPRMAQLRVMLRLWGAAVADVFGSWAAGAPAVGLQVLVWAAELVLIGAVAEMVMALPMAMYFHRATMFALPANTVSVPLVAVLVPMAVATLCGMLLNPWAAAMPAALTASLLHGIAGAIGVVSRIRTADIRVPGPAWWVAALAVLCWAFCCWAVRQGSRWAIAAALLLPVSTAMVLWPERALTAGGRLEVTAIDVGQGDSLFLVAPDGRTMLVDAGGPVGGVDEARAATSRFDVGEEVVSPYLWSRRFRRLDVLALTHAHSDHMGGMAAVLRSFRPRELWVGIDAHTEAYAELLREAAGMGVTVRHLHAGDRETWGAAQVAVLAPALGYSNAGDPKNDDSLVLRVDFGRSSALLEGDAEAPSELAMLAGGHIHPVTLLKVGHHGSRTSTTPEFLNAAAPRAAVISVGRGNRFGHPRLEVIQRVATEGARLYRTDQFGQVTFLMDGDGGIKDMNGAFE